MENEPRVRILEQGEELAELRKKSSVPLVPWWKKIDLQDVFTISGFVCLVSGVSFIFWPAGLILAGLIFYAHVYLIQKSSER
jgi:hypothetical protein